MHREERKGTEKLGRVGGRGRQGKRGKGQKETGEGTR